MLLYTNFQLSENRTVGLKTTLRTGPSRTKFLAAITAVRNTVGRSFSKLTLIKTFHRSTMTNERLTNLAIISIESETAKTLDTTELTKTFTSLKTWKKSFSWLEI